MSQSGQKRIKILLLFTMLFVFGVVIAVFIGYRTVSNPEEMILSSVIQDDATISIERIQQTSTKDGIKEWSLDADSAQFDENKKQAVFNGLSVVFYMQDGQTVRLTARKGYLNTETRDMSIQGDVVADDGDFRMKTEHLDYKHQRRLLKAPKPVQISGISFHLNAETAQYDLISNKSTFIGNVEGVIFDRIN